MALDPKDIQKAIDEGAPPVHVRNINVDTHIGQAVQRPYALLEDHMARVTLGHTDIKALNASLKSAPEVTGLPEGAPNPNEVHEVNGALVRYVVGQGPREAVMKDGVPHERISFEMRHVAASQQAARAASENGTPTDFWNGFTWLRDGFKPEHDFPVMAQAAAKNAEGQSLVFDAPMSPTAAARLQHEVNVATLSQPPMPVERSAARKEGAK